MKHLLTLLILLTCSFVAGGAQELVNPDMPGEIEKLNQGLIIINEFNAGFGVGTSTVPYSKSFTGFTSVIGTHINKRFILGVGSGLSVYNGGSLVPLFLDVRYVFIISRLSSYLFTDGGLLLNSSNLDNTKVMVNPGLGFRYSLSRRVAFLVSGGMLIQSENKKQDAFFNLKTGVSVKF